MLLPVPTNKHEPSSGSVTETNRHNLSWRFPPYTYKRRGRIRLCSSRAHFNRWTADGSQPPKPKKFILCHGTILSETVRFGLLLPVFAVLWWML